MKDKKKYRLQFIATGHRTVRIYRQGDLFVICFGVIISTHKTNCLLFETTFVFPLSPMWREDGVEIDG